MKIYLSSLGLILVLIILLPIFYTDGYLSLISVPKPLLRFHVIGDFGQPSPSWPYPILPCKQVALSMNQVASVNPISMVLTVGDNAYSVNSDTELFGVIKEMITGVFTGENISSVPWYLSYGNHDLAHGKYYGELLEEFYDNVNMPTGDWSLTQVMDGFKVDFTFLAPGIVCEGGLENSKVRSECEDMNEGSDQSDSYEWLERHLKEVSEDPEVLWKIVVTHYSMFSVSNTGLDSNNLIFLMLPLLRKYKVDLVLSGHNHNMQYFVNYPEKHENFTKQQFFEECMIDAEIKCNGEALHCVFSNASCPNSNLTCEERTSLEDSWRIEEFERKVVFKKGEALHQVVQGAGGADLDPFCPGIDTPNADYLFGLAQFGFTEVTIDRYGMYIKYIVANSSEVIFESSIMI